MEHYIISVKYLYAYDVVLYASFQLLRQGPFKGTHREKKCNSNSLPPCQEYNRFES